MIILPGADLGQDAEQRSATFSGTVWAQPVASGSDGVTIALINFSPCARTYWHHHERGQILHVTAGVGRICTAGEQPRLLRAGDVVWVPPGERHWHGAAPNSFMSHLAISLGTTAWSDEVAETDYTATPDPVRT